MNRLEHAINSKPIKTRLKIRSTIYIVLMILTGIIWGISEKSIIEIILFIVMFIILTGSLYFNYYDVEIELNDTKDEIINKMAELIEFKDSDTGHHVKRVSEYTRLLATLDGRLSIKEINLLAQASPLHDIGKIAIDDSVLTKPEKLTKEEFEKMKKHPVKGYEIFKDSKKDYLKVAAKIAYEHHEKWDGSGYPRGLKGDEISLEGRITAIADVFDALAHDRVYKKAWSQEEIYIKFEEWKGSHFDPKLMQLFLDNKEEFVKIKETYK